MAAPFERIGGNLTGNFVNPTLESGLKIDVYILDILNRPNLLQSISRPLENPEGFIGDVPFNITNFPVLTDDDLKVNFFEDQESITLFINLEENPDVNREIFETDSFDQRPDLQQAFLGGSFSDTFTKIDSQEFTSTTGVGTNSFTWGEDDITLDYSIAALGDGDSDPRPDTITSVGDDFTAYENNDGESSSLVFNQANSINVDVPTGFLFGSEARNASDPFVLGRLEYKNGTTARNTGATEIDLSFDINITNPSNVGSGTFTKKLFLTNTPNVDDPRLAADIVSFDNSISSIEEDIFAQLDDDANVSVQFTTDRGVPLELEILGFGNITGNGFEEETSFFVEEGETAQADVVGRFVNPCESIIDGAVTIELKLNPEFATPDPSIMTANFTPNFGLSLDEAAELCGYTEFRWINKVTSSPYPILLANGEEAPTPRFDPPKGGYLYQIQSENPTVLSNADDLVFYSSDFNAQIKKRLRPNTLDFVDIPVDSRLQPGEFKTFSTSLVGLTSESTNEEYEVLYTFTWKSSTSGTIGGVSVATSQNFIPPDPGATGGIFDVNLDLNPDELSPEVLSLLQTNGAENIFLDEEVIIDGGNAKDDLSGTDVGETILGGNGKDRLNGGDGNDTLLGGNGKDTLEGGSGDDVLYGERAKDIFVITHGQGTDTIADFEDGSDQILLVGSLNFGDIVLREESGSTQVISPTGEITAIIQDVSIDSFSADDFIFQ